MLLDVRHKVETARDKEGVKGGEGSESAAGKASNTQTTATA